MGSFYCAYGGKHGIVFFHKFSPNKVGIKLSVHGKYTTYNSRKPVKIILIRGWFK